MITEHADDSVSIYIGNYYKRLIPRIDDFGSVDPLVTRNSGQDYNSYFPIVGNGEGPNFETIPGKSYYYAGTSRIAMKTENNETIWIYGDHLGSTSVTADKNGDELSRTKYFAWGTTRYSTGAQATAYGYTGQMQVDNIYYYNARWPKVPETQWRGYDPMLGRFMQADTIVPSHQGTQGFDRYAYVNNNPLKHIDSTGQWACDINADCFIDGWNKDYTQKQKGNTCAVFSQAVGLSILSGDLVKQNDIQVIWPLTYTGIGVPVNLQVSGIITNYRNIEATPMTGDREAIIGHLLLDEPVVFTVAMPWGMVGHTATAIGFNSKTNQLIIHDSGFGAVMNEDVWVSGWQDQIEMRYPHSDRYKSYSNFDYFQSGSNLFIQPYSFVVLRKTQWSGGSSVGIPIYGGGGNRLFSPFLEMR